MCTCERFLVGVEYRTKQKKKKKKEKTKIGMNPFFHLECQNSNSFFYSQNVYKTSLSGRRWPNKIYLVSL